MSQLVQFDAKTGDQIHIPRAGFYSVVDSYPNGVTLRGDSGEEQYLPYKRLIDLEASYQLACLEENN